MIDYDELAQEYGLHRRVHSEVLKSLIQTSQVTQNSKVLEVGCGTGNYIGALHKVTNAASWGIDSSQQMITQAIQHSPQVTFKEGIAENLEFDENTFDCVFSVDVIHHLENVVPYFTEIFRVLKPGGHISTVTDSEEIIRNRRPLAFYFPETISVDLNRYPSTLALRKRMGDAGFQKIQQVQVELSFELTDIQAYRDKVFSCLHLISSEAFRNGLARMEEDLTRGPIQANSRYLLIFGQKPDRIVFM